MQEPVFTGTCTALVTPFDEIGAIRYSALDALIEEQIDAGVDAVCVCGTTGEGATLSTDEHKTLVQHCVRTVNHRVKVIAGSGSNNTATAVTLSQNAQDAGADALLIVTPYYNKTSQAGLIRHYTYIADRVSLPIILYNVPSRTGVSFTAETYQILARHPHIRGVKEASGSLSLLTHTRLLCPEEFTVWSGNDDQVVPMMALGAQGVISAAANLVPESMCRLAQLCQVGAFQSAAQLQISLTPLIDALFCDVNPIPVKEALSMLGKDTGRLRLPLCPLSAAHHKILQDAMGAFPLSVM